MIIKADIYCAFDHFLILGLARILQDRWDTPIFLQWTTRADEVELSGGRLDTPDAVDAQEAICEFVDEVYKGGEGILMKMICPADINAKGTKEFSPFSPHKNLDPANKKVDPAVVKRRWNECREELLDEVGNGNTLKGNTLIRVFISCLGKPNWWTEKKPKGGNHWEFTPKNGGSDFVGGYVNKITQEIVKDFKDAKNEWEPEKVYQSLIEEGIGEQNEFRKTLGLKSPKEFTTNIQSLCAIWGFAQFACRPVAPRNTQTENAEPNTLGVVIPEGVANDKRFILPIPDEPITVNRYCAILRNRKLYTCPACDTAGEFDADWERDRQLLQGLGISHVVPFKKVKAKRVNTPEYYLFGKSEEIVQLKSADD